MKSMSLDQENFINGMLKTGKAFVRSTGTRAVVVAGAALSSVAANAAVDVSTVTSAITDAATAIATVGAAYLAMRVGGRVFKWIQAAL